MLGIGRRMIRYDDLIDVFEYRHRLNNIEYNSQKYREYDIERYLGHRDIEILTVYFKGVIFTAIVFGFFFQGNRHLPVNRTILHHRFMIVLIVTGLGFSEEGKISKLILTKMSRDRPVQ